MQKGVLMMTAEEARRLYVVQQVLEQTLRQRHAAELLGCSVRQVKRLVRRVRQAGPTGIVHRLRGRPSNRRHPDALKQRVLTAYRRQYADFGPTLACEKLAERDRLPVGRETLRRWLVTAGLWQGPRRAPVHRRWRERRACAGELLQLDGSHHAWLEARGPQLVLMAYIDDATSEVFARFYDYEGTLPALESFARYIRRYGLPQSVYVDRHTTYRAPGKRSLADELAGRPRPQSQFERALGELGVSVIPAYSPQAKGRIERLFGTFQDRVVKELRLAGVATRETANAFLARYLPSYNRRFRVPARQPANLHRPAPPRPVLQRILAIRQTHTLRHDNTLQHAGTTYLLQHRWAGARPTTLQAEVRLHGRLYLLDGDQALRYQALPARPHRPLPRRRVLAARPPHIRPPADHPWRRLLLARRRTAHHLGTVLPSHEGDISIGR